MLLAFGPEDLERLAIPIGLGIAGLTYLIVPSWRRSLAGSWEQGRAFRERHPILAWILDAVGVILLVGLAVWIVMKRD